MKTQRTIEAKVLGKETIEVTEKIVAEAVNVFTIKELEEKRKFCLNQKLQLLKQLKLAEEQIAEMDSLLEKIGVAREETTA